LLNNIQEKKWFWLSENRWNNSFNFSEWKKIWIPSIKIWKIDDLELWEKIVFSDIEDWILKESIWLKNHLWILEKNKSPVFVCDNHNRAMEAWNYFKEKTPLLIHIDQHRDEADYWKIENWEKDLRICDYINWAKDNNWIQKNHISLCESKDFKKYWNLEKPLLSWTFHLSSWTSLSPWTFHLSSWTRFRIWNQKDWDCVKKSHKQIPDIFPPLCSGQAWTENSGMILSNNFILNIDLDIFVPEQTLISHKKIWDLIFKLEKKATLVTIATSPLFLDQKKAIELLNYYFSTR